MTADDFVQEIREYVKAQSHFDHVVLDRYELEDLLDKVTR